MYNTINSKTIYALSSAPGKAGIAVIRVSGPEAEKIGKLFKIDLPDPKKVQIVKLVHPYNGDFIDKALVTFFESPNSFTGENMVELSIHGSRAIKDLIFSILSEEESFSYAEPGEFTRRAFLNGKLDLVEVEGLADLINAETEFQRKQAYDQMEGKLSNLYMKWKGQLLKNLSYLEATIDFVEEEISPEITVNQIKDIEGVLNELDTHLNDSNKGERLRDGFHIIIAGSPNTGKSSLLNHLSNRDIAIVSDEAGTTRDSLDAYLDIKGFPVIITDTAGIRKAKTEVENIGIKKSQIKMSEADLVLWLMDSSINKNDKIPDNIKDKSIEVWTKSDIAIHSNKDIIISTKKDQGIIQLIDIIGKFVEKGCRTEGSFITRSRHRDALEKTKKHLSIIVKNDQLDAEVIAEELRSAVNSLARITGHIDVEDLLEVIFKDFCIGK
tara:strand:- start:1007 stop:2326 length:1320 start_codon:yes stop_codon:yes gene_type:complete